LLYAKKFVYFFYQADDSLGVNTPENNVQKTTCFCGLCMPSLDLTITPVNQDEPQTEQTNEETESVVELTA
jgi:hypothetical protein